MCGTPHRSRRTSTTLSSPASRTSPSRRANRARAESRSSGWAAGPRGAAAAASTSRPTPGITRIARLGHGRQAPGKANLRGAPPAPVRPEMECRTARAWIVLVLLAIGCRGERITSFLFPPPPPPGPGGTAQLAFRLGGSGADRVAGVVADPGGNVYVAGTFTGTVDFDPGNGVTALTSMGGTDGFLAKYTAAGAVVWAVRVGGTGADSSTPLARDGARILFLAGGFEGPAAFGAGASVPALVSQGGEDGFVAKFGADGTVVWANRFGGPGSEDVADLALAAGGGGSAIISFGATDGFVVSFTGAGAVRWAFPVGGTDADLAAAVRVTAAGNVVVAGTFRGIADFAPGAAVTGLTATGGSDVFLASYSTGGTLVWAKGIGGLAR